MTNSKYPGLRVSVDFRLEEGLVRDDVPYLEPVAPGILSDDGYFRDAQDIAEFQMEWEKYKPDPDSILDGVSVDYASYDCEYFAVVATGGRDARDFDSPVREWVSTFKRDRGTGEWSGSTFEHIQK